MPIEEVARNIYRIPVPLPGNPLKELNSYLIKDPKSSLLIDTGFNTIACKDALFSGLKELDTDPGAVDIFLTHMHSDHAGLSTDIISEEKQIYISETDHSLLLSVIGEGNKRQGRLAERLYREGMPEYIIKNITRLNPEISFAGPAKDARYSIVKDGEILHAGGYTFKCILTPGHSPGHMCLWEEEIGIMLTGDHVLFDITPNITTWPIVRDSLGDYLDSLRAVLNYPVKLALPGHRKSGDFYERVRQLLQHHQVRLTEVEQLVSNTPGSTPYEIAGKMIWKIRARNWEEFPDSQKIFAVGECMSHLDYLMHRERIKCTNDRGINHYY